MKIKELVVISGKGGTGKTSLTASFAILARRPVLVDCDVDAADLHLLLSPHIEERHDFYSGREAVIRAADCDACGVCDTHCRFGAVLRESHPGAPDTYRIDPVACEGCGVCVHFCPQQAIDFPERLCGQWMVSSTRAGPMVHAKLGVAAENSGKLVSTVRREAVRIAEEQDRDLIIVDGPPGIGCPVIASLTGASLALVVTEPTVSGEHDLTRVLSLTRHFGIAAMVCMNKWDINPRMTEEIEAKAREAGAMLAGRVRYDRGITDAQMNAETVVETAAPSAADVMEVWNHLGLGQERVPHGTQAT